MRRLSTQRTSGRNSTTSVPEKIEEKKNEIEIACRALFDAYDVDESGELDREEFLRIEMRLAFERGDIVREAPLFAKLTLTDRDNSGQLSFEEFRDAQLRNFSEERATGALSKEEIVTRLNNETKTCLLERQKMGPRFHAGIRKALQRIFQLYDTSGDAKLCPEEWISAQKIVALEINDDIDPGWIDEAAFKVADTNHDGVLSEAEYLEASFSMFEVCKLNMAQLMKTLEGVVSALEKRQGAKNTESLAIMMQTAEVDAKDTPTPTKPEFQPPRVCQDAATKDADAYKQVGEIQLPTNLKTVEEVKSLLRLVCDMSTDTWISVFFLGPNPEGEGGSHPVTLLRDSNTQATLDYLSKPNAAPRLYLKNVRAKPKRLVKQSMALLEDREALLPKRVGNSWGIDWETQLVGAGRKYPVTPSNVVAIGDALVVEVPTTDSFGKYTYSVNVFMDGALVLSRPVEEVLEPKVKKKKAKKGAPEEEEPKPDPLLQLSFVALTEGKCVLFVDISWEDQEGMLCAESSLATPVKENSVARIGPMEIEVKKPEPGAAKDKTFQWWNGEKWTNKKGPAKKKGKR